MVNEAAVDSDLRKLQSNEWKIRACSSVFLAALALAYVVLVFRAYRTIVDKYMAATDILRHEALRWDHEGLRKIVISVAITAFIFGGLCGSAALLGMTLQSFWSVEGFFVLLFLLSCLLSSLILFLSAAIVDTI